MISWIRVSGIALLTAAAWASANLADASVFMIGNSLTWDTRPAEIDDADWHVYCNRNLQYIHDEPTEHCIGSSLPWTTALAQNSYDYVTVQPFAGTTLAEDVAIISGWMQMQPNATFVLHTGWLGPTSHAGAYTSTGTTTMTPSPAYFNALEQQLAALHPGREIRRTQAADLLYDIAQDIGAGESPFSAFSDIYRDHVHMTYGDGQYLMHNLMRLALDQDYVLTPQVQSSATRQYLNSKLLALVVPEPSSVVALLFVASCTLMGRVRPKSSELG